MCFLTCQTYYLRQGGYVIVVVCLSVCLLATLRICMKLSGKVRYGPINKLLNFGCDPDHESGYGLHCQNVPLRRYALSQCV